MEPLQIHCAGLPFCLAVAFMCSDQFTLRKVLPHLITGLIVIIILLKRR